MSKFRIERLTLGKRKRPMRMERAAARPMHTLVALVLVIALAATILYALRGSGSARENPGWSFRLQVPEITAEQVATLARNKRASRIDAFFSSRQSPLAGTGRVFLDVESETGVSAELIAAITLAESSCATDGSLSDTNHNAWGMKGPQPALGIQAQGGYCWWPDWPSAIHGAAGFIRHYWGPAQSAGELKGYAASGGSWASNVEGVRQSII